MKKLSLILFLILGLICFNAYADLEVDGTATVKGFKMITGAAEGKVLTSDVAGIGTWRVLPASAGILSVTGTNGIISNTVSGNVTLQADTAYLQRRVAGSCAAGNSIRVINANGTVTCEAIGGGSWTLNTTNLYTHDVDLGQNWKVGIGTNTPSQKLSVNGDLWLPANGIIYVYVPGEADETFIHNSGTASTSVGHGSLSDEVTSTNPISSIGNTAIGTQILQGINGGQYNTAIGNVALQKNKTGSLNTVVGSYCSSCHGFGSNNTVLGADAGHGDPYDYPNCNDPGDGNVFLGLAAGYWETGNNKLYINSSQTESSSYIPNPSEIPLIFGDFATGSVGFRTINPAFKFQVVINGSNEGHVDATGAWARTSDIRFKKNVVTLKDSLDKVLKIRGVRFDWENEADSEIGSGRHIGFVAQELEKEFPEFVDTGTDGYKSVAYASITPVLVEAIKELKADTDGIEKRVQALEISRLR